MSHAPRPMPDHEKPAPPPALPDTPQAQRARLTDHACVPGQRARAHAATNQILGAAHAWWATRRPLSFTLHEHLQNPTINTCGEAEHELAQAVAEWILAASLPGTQPDMPFEPRCDDSGRVLGYTRARTPLEAAMVRRGLTVPQLAQQLCVPDRAVYAWCAGTYRPRGNNRVLVEKWMAEEEQLAGQEVGGA